MDEFTRQRILGMRNDPIMWSLPEEKTCPPCHIDCNQCRNCPTKHEPGTVIPLPKGLTLDEWLQLRMPSDNMGFALALAIVGGIFIGVLLVHAWARM